MAALTIMSTYRTPFPLFDLPPELLGRVCDHLPDEQLKYIRLVCKALQTHSIAAFGQRFFDHLIVILHPTSLDIFMDIAAHKQLSKYVRRVSVSGERIGQSIKLEEDEQKHITLQKHLEESGLDSRILMDAFSMLKNLRTVRIDIEQFQFYDNEDNHLGLRCGSKYLQPMPAYSRGRRDEDAGYNRIYSLVPGILEKTCLPRINLEMAFWDTACYDDGNNPNVMAHFDVQYPSWKDEVAKRTRSLSFTGIIHVPWVCDLLQSAKDLHSIKVFLPVRCTDNGSRISYYSYTHLEWPNLRRLHLGNLVTSHLGFLGLLEVHLNSLEEINIFTIGFVKGTWSCALTTLSRMPNLKALELQGLLERRAYSHPNFSDHMSDSENVYRLKTMGVRKVARTTKALCERMATTPVEKGSTFGVEGGELYSHTVDLCRGLAASLESE